MRYFKATRPDGRDFHSGTVDYGAALASGAVIEHPAFDRKGTAASYLSVATVATDCTGMSWPCRLFEVEPVGRAYKVGDDLPNKRAVRALRVVRELPAHEALGPQGEHVAALIVHARSLTAAELDQLAAARAAARDAAWDAARAAARDAARDAAWDAAWAAALGLATRDLITSDQYRTLVGPWASVCGWPHPDDEARYGGAA